MSASKRLRSEPAPIVVDLDSDGVPEVFPGSLCRLVGLNGAAHLNGEICTVLQFAPESGRYEVILRKGGEVKAVKPVNLAALPVLEEIAFIKEEIVRPEVKASEARPALRRLDKLPISLEILRETRIGKVVNELAKRLEQHEDVVEASRQLVRRWKEVLHKAQLDAAPLVPPGGQTASTGEPRMSPTGSESEIELAQCMARTMPGGQCPRQRCQDDVEYCAQHLAEVLAGKGLPHGRADGVDVPTYKTMVNGGSVSSSAVPQAAGEIRPITRHEDAIKLVTAMREATSDSTRLDTLAALENSHERHFPAFVSSGGLGVLECWIRSGGGQGREGGRLRWSCIHALQKIPVTSQELHESRIPAAVSLVAQLNGRAFGFGSSSADDAVRGAAAAILDRWRADGLLCAGQESYPANDATNRSRIDQENPAQTATEDIAAQAAAMAAAEMDAAATVAAEAAEAAEAARRRLLPPELASLDSRIAQVLLDRPDVREFLVKHPHVMNNMSPDSIRFLTRNLKNSKETQMIAQGCPDFVEDERSTGVTITLSNLHPEATEADVQKFVARCGIRADDVYLPRESRRQRSCCTAYVLVASRDAARDAVRRLQQEMLLGRAIIAELADGHGFGLRNIGPADAAAGPAIDVDAEDVPRVQWSAQDELWEVALFDKFETVEEFAERLRTGVPPVEGFAAANQHGMSARFEEWARSEREQEGKVVREALAGQGQH